MHELLHMLGGEWQHWAFEVISGVILFVALTPYRRFRQRRHDAKAHPVIAYASQQEVHEVLRLTQWELARLRERLLVLERP